MAQLMTLLSLCLPLAAAFMAPLAPAAHRAPRFSPLMQGGKGFGGGEATRDPDPTEIDPNDPKGKQQAIHKAESFQEYLAKRQGSGAVPPPPPAPAAYSPPPAAVDAGDEDLEELRRTVSQLSSLLEEAEGAPGGPPSFQPPKMPDFQALSESDTNPFDAWWAERRARNTVGKRREAPPVEALQLDTDTVALVLSEFVDSKYARSVCNHVQIQPTDFGQIDGMFDSVQVGEANVVVKLKRVFTNVEGLMDRLAVYLRARIPHIKAINSVHRDGVDIY